MRTLLLILLLLSLGLPAAWAQEPPSASATTTYDWKTKWTEVGSEITFSWCDPNPEGSVTWDIEVLLYPSRVRLVTAQGLTERQFTWTPTTAGHYILRARSVNIEPPNETSVWSESHKQTELEATAECPVDNPVDWLLYAEVPAPTDGGFD